MTRQAIAVGTVANDGSGDTLRRAGQKINENFVEIYQKLGGGDSNFLSTSISIEDSAIVFEGGLADSFETRLNAFQPTSDNFISLPDLSGQLITSAGAQSIADKTLTNATIVDPVIQGSGFKDSNGNSIINLVPSGNGVANDITIANSATGIPVRITTTGTDTNIDLEISGKGSGTVDLQKISVGTTTQQASGVANVDASHIICDKSTQLNITLLDGTVEGELKIFTNTGTGNAVITPNNYITPGGNLTIPQYGGATMIWTGSTWYVIGKYGF